MVAHRFVLYERVTLMENVVFKIDVRNPRPSQWLVYSLHDNAGVMQFMGSCQIKNIMSIPDAKKHPMFSEIFPGDVEVTVKIHKMMEVKSDCTLWVNRYLFDNPRPFMMQFRASYQGRIALRCLETGEEFESLTECSTSHGISASALSNHLNGSQSYLTVGGRTYQHLKQRSPHADT